MPYAFLPLTLFSFAGIAGTLAQIGSDGAVEWSDALTFVFAGFVTLALFSQIRSLALLSPLGRRLRRPRSRPKPVPVLLNQPADHIAVDAALAGRRAAAAVRASVRGAQRALPLAVAVLGGAGLAALVALLVLYGSSAGVTDTGFLISALFAILGGYGYVQFIRALRRANWRGSPSALIRRAFYDSTRVYSGAHSFVQVGVSGAATAIVVTAGLAPIAFPGTPPFVLLGADPGSGRLVTVRPEDGSLTTAPAAQVEVSVSALAAVRRELKLPDGRAITASHVLAVVQTAQAQILADLNLRTGETNPVVRLRRRVDVAGLGMQRDNTIVVLERSGALSRISPATGEVTPLANAGASVSVATLDSRSGNFLALSGNTALWVVPESGRTATMGTLKTPASIDPCGVARLANHVIVADRSSSSLLVFDEAGEAIGTIGPSPLEAPVCGIVAVPRR
jgi:hypothetical protein